MTFWGGGGTIQSIILGDSDAVHSQRCWPAVSTACPGESGQLCHVAWAMSWPGSSGCSCLVLLRKTLFSLSPRTLSEGVTSYVHCTPNRVTAAVPSQSILTCPIPGLGCDHPPPSEKCELGENRDLGVTVEMCVNQITPVGRVAPEVYPWASSRHHRALIGDARPQSHAGPMGAAPWGGACTP